MFEALGSSCSTAYNCTKNITQLASDTSQVAGDVAACRWCAPVPTVSSFLSSFLVPLAIKPLKGGVFFARFSAVLYKKMLTPHFKSPNVRLFKIHLPAVLCLLIQWPWLTAVTTVSGTSFHFVSFLHLLKVLIVIPFAIGCISDKNCHYILFFIDYKLCNENSKINFIT